MDNLPNELLLKIIQTLRVDIKKELKEEQREVFNKLNKQWTDRCIYLLDWINEDGDVDVVECSICNEYGELYKSDNFYKSCVCCCVYQCSECKKYFHNDCMSIVQEVNGECKCIQCEFPDTWEELEIVI